MATEYLFKKISELPPISETPFTGLLPLSDGNESVALPLNRFRLDLFNNPNFTGQPKTPTPNEGDSSETVANTEWVQNELADLGLNPATTENYGTVRTNTTDPVPTVYLKTEVDNLWNTTRPVEVGGTGAQNPTDARANLEAAQSGVNNDITALSALTDVPTVIANLVTNALKALLPPGSVSLYAGATVPSGWLPCDGQAVSRTTYADLFAAIGTAFGAGNGSTTFHLPNFTGRMPMGDGTSPVSGADRPRGTQAGVEARILSTANLPTHSHGGGTGYRDINHNHSGSTTTDGSHGHSAVTTTDGAHSHSYDQVYPVFLKIESGGAGMATSDYKENDPTVAAGSHSHGVYVSAAGDHAHGFNTGYSNQTLYHNHTIAAEGSGAAFSVLNPVLVLKYMIKV